MTDERSTKTKDRTTAVIVIAFGAVVVIFVLYALLMAANVLDASGFEEYASLGDSFGTVSALFSGLAFAGLIVTILFQRKELRLQQEELRLTRQEMAGQRQQMELQNANLRLQAFENTFFKMLSFHHEIVGNIANPGKTSRETLDELNDEIWKTLSIWRERCDDYEEVVRKAFGMTHNYFEAVHHYLSHLYEVICYIDSSDVNDKQFYANVLRSQLSGPEVEMLFHFGMSPGGRKLRPLIEHYGLLEQLRFRGPEYQDYAGEYNLGAFGVRAGWWADDPTEADEADQSML